MRKAPVDSENYHGEYAEAPEEEESKGKLTLEEYMASKKKTTFKKEARKPEEMKKTNVEKGGEEKTKTETIATNLKNSETYNAAQTKNESSNLLGF
jgi:hypothetical protein